MTPSATHRNTPRDHVTTPAATTPQGRQRFDHQAACSVYVELGARRTFTEVAKRFHVSITAVRNIAKRDGWAEIARKADAQAQAKALERAVRSREQQVAQTARIRDRAADRIEARLGEESMDDNDVLRALEWGEKNVRLNLGESTEHVAIAEVQGLLAAHLRATAPFIPKADREAWMRAMDDATSGLLALEERSAA